MQPTQQSSSHSTVYHLVLGKVAQNGAILGTAGSARCTIAVNVLEGRARVVTSKEIGFALIIIACIETSARASHLTQSGAVTSTGGSGAIWSLLNLAILVFGSSACGCTTIAT